MVRASHTVNLFGNRISTSVKKTHPNEIVITSSGGNGHFFCFERVRLLIDKNQNPIGKPNIDRTYVMRYIADFFSHLFNDGDFLYSLHYIAECKNNIFTNNIRYETVGGVLRAVEYKTWSAVYLVAVDVLRNEKKVRILMLIVAMPSDDNTDIICRILPIHSMPVG